MPNYHISKDKKAKHWRITREGAERISDFARTQEEAEAIAKQLAGNSGGGEVRIHGLDGKIRDSDTVAPANDPRNIRDTRH
jgi:uncharacterized protein DUF2188